MSQLFGTSFNLELGSLRMHISIRLDDRADEPAQVRLEDLPRFELGAK